MLSALMANVGVDPMQADSASTLRGQYPSYRETLQRLCYRLDIKCPSTLLTEVGPCLLFLWRSAKDLLHVIVTKLARGYCIIVC